MRVVSWNINGLRSGLKKGFLRYLGRSGADIVGLQEVRARPEDLPERLHKLPGWHTAFIAGEKRGYSGVGMFARRPPDRFETSLGQPRFDREARVFFAWFGELLVVNAYFPKGSGKNRDNSRIPYKLAFYRRLFAHLEAGLRRDQRILVMGDFNTAHQEIDLARPKDNVENSGFRPEERRELARWLSAGWVDTFRHQYPGTQRYSWWSNRPGIRARNIGWRIDYVLASPGAMPFLKDAFISTGVLGSDHCPVGVDVDEAICG